MTSVEKYYQALKKFAPTQGLTLNPDWEIVQPLLEGLLANGERYGLRTCRCRPASGEKEKDRDIVCPCVYAKPDIEEFGACYCWLYVSQDWIDKKVPHRQIPERRPPEKTFDF
ncbi:MAG: ferredoxin-thioredoxin reductase catalytic domain-containing protein [bacterium]|nr:ferredoxin-thioredoxin reductase catalytic domain-containing protein [bacterium]